MTDQPPTSPTCPQCGTADVTYDWKATVSVRVLDGKVEHVVLGGIFGCLPDQIFCADCGEQSIDFDDPAQRRPLEAAAAVVEAGLPDRLVDELHNGKSLYGSGPA